MNKRYFVPLVLVAAALSLVVTRRVVGPAHGRRSTAGDTEGRSGAGHPPAQPGDSDVRLGGGPVPAAVGRPHEVDSVGRNRAGSRDLVDGLEGQQDVDVQAPERRELLERRPAHRNRRGEDLPLLPRPEDGDAGEEPHRHGQDDHRGESDDGGLQAQDRQRAVPDRDHQRQDREDGQSRDFSKNPITTGPYKVSAVRAGLERHARPERRLLRRQGEADRDRHRQGGRPDRGHRRPPERRSRRDVGAPVARGEEGDGRPERPGQARDSARGLAVAVLGGRHHEPAVQQRQEPAGSGLRDRPPDDPEVGLRRARDRLADEHACCR